MQRSLLVLFLAFHLISGRAIAGPEDHSRFDGTPYAAQNALYDFNFAKPEDALPAFAYINNHLKAIKDFGKPEASHIVIVAHGNELHAFSRHNRAAYPGMYEALKALSDAGVQIKVCRNAAKGRGYGSEDFYDVITVVPAAVIEIAKWQNLGYSYMYAGWFPRITREEIMRQHPALN